MFFLIFNRPTKSCTIILGSIPTEHSFAAQLEAIYKYGTTFRSYIALESI